MCTQGGQRLHFVWGLGASVGAAWMDTSPARFAGVAAQSPEVVLREELVSDCSAESWMFACSKAVGLSVSQDWGVGPLASQQEG
jgi:hypothetical protein